MSREYGHLRVSGTRIEVFWVCETERRYFRSAWPLYNPFPLWQRTSCIYQDHRRLTAGSQLPSSRLPITRVSAYDRIPGQLLELFGVIETPNVPQFRHKSYYCF